MAHLGEEPLGTESEGRRDEERRQRRGTVMKIQRRLDGARTWGQLVLIRARESENLGHGSMRREAMAKVLRWVRQGGEGSGLNSLWSRDHICGQATPVLLPLPPCLGLLPYF